MVWWLVWLACAGRHNDRALERAIAAIDRAWVSRAKVGLPAVDAALDRAELIAPNASGVAWRRVRERAALGLTLTGAEAMRVRAEGRAVGVRCLDAGGGPLRNRVAWQASFVGLPGDQQPCAAWLTLVWAQWWVAMDPEAAALDTPTLSALLEAADRWPDPARILPWSAALFKLGDPSTVDSGRAELMAAPVRLEALDDLLNWSIRHDRPTTELSALRQLILETPSTAPETDAIQRRAKALKW